MSKLLNLSTLTIGTTVVFVPELLAALDEIEDIGVALLTGNILRGAELKLNKSKETFTTPVRLKDLKVGTYAYTISAVGEDSERISR